ncbi:MAG: bifunctional methylenetetrahydrofolate dehydrogenase/methenyltetrahydrofolate cyclohydrolase FolD [Actinomycetota bacterium]|jgi:methylenetetrahydrofolate dehydrogenase (NADP+)/methenyltetrahydrofolate cyclohydrolase|nr:bifunctional methylenetetrahydrofolate dehydrogenase/methenyltetrahydrofolate cyclohydrolase FolD [Actinomycetota bacterium]
MAKLISGVKISSDIKNEIKEEVKELIRVKGIRPGLGVILVGEDPASRVYVANKEKGCAEVGFLSETARMPADATEEQVLKQINLYQKREDIHGLLVQLPLPSHINKDKILHAISPDKDVDGFHPVNIGKLVAQQEGFVPATPAGVIEMMKREEIKIKGKNATMVGHSEIVGKPCALLLLNEWATVTVCHIETRDLKYHTRNADILVVAVGKPKLISGDMVKEGAVVIDIGINRITADKADEKLLEWRKDDFDKKGATLVGDVDFQEVEPRASAITPVPGGVGPMTIAMLLKNTLQSAKRFADIR